MPFSYGYHKLNKLIKESLQVRYAILSLSPHRGKRVLLSASKGSMTVEAAVLLPVFLLAVCCIVRVFLLMNFQNLLQTDLDNTAANLSCLQYVSEEEDKISKAYAYGKVLSGKAADMAENAGISGGRLGMSMQAADLSKENEINSIVVNYTWKTSYAPGNLSPHLSFIQRCSYIPWIGESLVPDAEEADEEMVYVTPNGTVYHQYKDCTYLTRSIKRIRIHEVKALRNAAGAKYYHCEKCTKNVMSAPSYVYVTVYGDRYHYDKECRTLKRYIQKIPVSEAGNRRLCVKCNQRKD